MLHTLFRTSLPLAAAVLLLAAAAVPAADATYRAELSGARNVPDPIKTPATGLLELTVSPGGQTVSYVLTVKDLDNPIGADIHLGPANANGPLVLKLYQGNPPHKGAFSGVLAQGKFGAADLLGSMKGAPLSDLLEMCAEGNAYVNIHTSDSTDPPNSGPGDYRLGEIRGQIAP